jgi:hypothetical protein
MIAHTKYTIESNILQEAICQLPNIDFKLSLNEPSGDFFYDPWKIKETFKNTVWETVLNSLDSNIGEARLINLSPGTCYHSHSDIDDRWHLTIQAKESYLIDITNQKLHKCEGDGVWSIMDAGRIHSAANFGNIDRVQLVVRKLLQPNVIDDPVSIEITLKEKRPDFRYVFDNTLSPWLNKANKTGLITNFKFNDGNVKFDISKTQLENLILDPMFEIKEP